MLLRSAASAAEASMAPKLTRLALTIAIAIRRSVTNPTLSGGVLLH